MVVRVAGLVLFAALLFVSADLRHTVVGRVVFATAVRVAGLAGCLLLLVA